MNIDTAARIVGHNLYGSRKVAKNLARQLGLAHNAEEFDALVERVETQHGPATIEDHIRRAFRTVWIVQCDQPYSIITIPGESPGIADCRRVSAMVAIGDLAAEVQRVDAIAQANARARR